MPKAMKPLIAIVLAVAVAAGAAVYLSRQPDQPEETAAATRADIKDGGHIGGPEKAALTLVEFGDYQCPSGGAYHRLVKDIMHQPPQPLPHELHHSPLAT